MTDIRIYVADLAAYNSGKLHGEWIDLDEHSCDPDSVQEEIDSMLSKSPVRDAEEFAIHDHEGLPGVGEFSSISEVCKIAELIQEHGDAARAALYISEFDEAKSMLENGFYEVESLAEYAQNYMEDCGTDLPSFLHVDWESTGRDLAMDMSQVRYNGTLYLFHS